MLLPDEILTEDAEHLFAEFKHWADDKIRDYSGLATVADFWARLGMPVPDKINKKEAELMQNFARRAGYGIAPDMRYHLVRPEQKDILFIPRTCGILRTVGGIYISLCGASAGRHDCTNGQACGRC